MPTSTLDQLVWRRVEEVLTNPSVIGQQVEHMRREDPTEADLSQIDRRIADVDRQRQKFVSHLSRLDADAAELVYVRLDALGITARKLVAERTVIPGRRRGMEAAQSQLDQLAVWCGTVAAKLGDMSYQQKRLAFDALGIKARVYRADHEPRYEIEANIPLVDDTVAFNTRSSTEHSLTVRLRWTDNDIESVSHELS